METCCRRRGVWWSSCRWWGAGRTLISKGFLEAAKKHARPGTASTSQTPIPGVCCRWWGVEPSEVHALLDEYLDFFPEERSR